MIVIAILMALTLFIVNRGQHSLTQVVDILLLAVSLAVAAVPEGLTAITTIVLSLGMNRMAERNVIVRKLNAVETLGSTTVICSDKTGTLTKNEMTVRTVVIPQGRVSLEGIGYDPQGRALQDGEPIEDPELLRQVQRTLRAASLASNARLVESNGNWSIQGDPTEGALLVAARKVGITDEMLAERFTRVGEVPFTSERKMMSIALQDSQREDHLTVTSKGAPDVLLGLCTRERCGPEEVPLTPARRAEILGTIDALAREALRTIGVAYRHIHRDEVSDVITDVDEKDLVFLGVVGMIDPPRPEAAKAVHVAAQAGIRTIMITGDHPTTAGAIARELAISAPGDKTMSGYELEKTDEASLAKEVQKISVFARVAPEHKLRIVRALKLYGAIVAMTGDGVNDAPALKAADIGVAMGITGTDVSKGAADMILTDDNFASIVAAVEEGRSIFANIQKFLHYLLSSNIGEVLVMFFGVLLAGVIGLTADEGVGIIVPLLATQILWINLLTDAGPALALGVDPADPGVMARSPRDPGKPVITKNMWYEIGFIGVIMGIGTLLVMDWSLPGGLIHQPGGSLPYAHTMAFTTLVFYQLYNSFNARSERESAFRGLFKNRWLWLAVSISALLQVLVIYTPFLQKPFGTVPLTATDWVVCLAVGSSSPVAARAYEIFPTTQPIVSRCPLEMLPGELAMPTSIRPVQGVIQPQLVLEGAGVLLKRSFPTSRLDYPDPFLLLDHFGSDNPEDYLAGFPTHPHRGIETVTYMLAGAVQHKDSIGNSGRIEAGDVQWMTAGGGILHEEMPQPVEGKMEGIPAVGKPARPFEDDPPALPGDPRRRNPASSIARGRQPACDRR